MIFVSTVRHKFRDDHELINYFDLRHRWEADDLKGFTKEMFRQRIAGEKRFSTPYYEDLYQKWLVGHTDPSAVSTSDPHDEHTQTTSFDTYLLPSST